MYNICVCNILRREAVSTVRKIPTLSIKLTDNSATKNGKSLTYPYAERERERARQSVCTREKLTPLYHVY